MPYSETHSYSIDVTLPKGVTISTGVPGINGQFIITITATSDTQEGAAAILEDGLGQLGSALAAEGITVPADVIPAPTPAPVSP